MAPSVQVMGRRLVVWMVAIAAGTQVMAQVLVEMIYGRGDAAMVWAIAAVVILLSAMTAESVKAYLEE